MTRRAWLPWGALLLALAAAAALLLAPARLAGPSALAPSADGWLAARTYLEKRGAQVVLGDHPLKPVAPGETLVLAFPFDRAPLPDEVEAVRRRVAAGGAVVFAYSGQPHDAAEELIGEAVGLRFTDVRGEPPLSPRRWYAWATAEWRLRPDAAFGRDAREIVVRAPRSLPSAPDGAQRLFQGEGGVPAVFAYSRGRGRVLALPADALSNARLGNPGNADLLESVSASFGPVLAFDEYAHGLAAPGGTPAGAGAPSLDLLVVQLFLLYGLCAWALGRRFGPVWQEPPAVASSTSGFLLGLGALHRDLGHSAQASWHLIQNAGALDPRVEADGDLRRRTFDAGDDAFVDIARRIARLQHGGKD